MTAQHPQHAFNVVPGEPQPGLLAPVAQFFRRAVAAVRRKTAAPAAFCPAGAAATTLLAHADAMHAASVPYLPAPRHDATRLPRRKPMVNRPPWPTAEQPVYRNGWQ